MRIAEYGQVYRYENSGSLRGLSRVRGLCQNDAHIYLDPKDAESEINKVLQMHEQCYAILGLKGYRYRLSKCDPKKMENFDGLLENWILCEDILRKCLEQNKLDYYEAVGEAAFYGPKIDVQMQMESSSEESIASVQLDFNSGEKFNLEFISSSGESQVPWVIHRAPLGSHERFIAMLLEYFGGQLPGWLCPVQVYLLPISDDQHEFANKLVNQLKENNIRVVLDQNSGSLSKRILLFSASFLARSLVIFVLHAVISFCIRA